MILFKQKKRVNKQRDFIARRMNMRNEETQLRGDDLFLFLFALVAGWLVLFQSGLF